MSAVPSLKALGAPSAMGTVGIPLAGRGGLRDLGDVLPKFRKMAEDAGRNPNSMEISLIGIEEDVDTIKRYADIGVTRVIPGLLPAKADTVLPIIDRWTKIMQAVNG